MAMIDERFYLLIEESPSECRVASESKAFCSKYVVCATIRTINNNQATVLLFHVLTLHWTVLPLVRIDRLEFPLKNKKQINTNSIPHPRMANTTTEMIWKIKHTLHNAISVQFIYFIQIYLITMLLPIKVRETSVSSLMQCSVSFFLSSSSFHWFIFHHFFPVVNSFHFHTL